MTNTLTIYHDSFHAFIKINYQGQTKIVGMYPHTDEESNEDEDMWDNPNLVVSAIAAQSIVGVTSYCFDYTTLGKLTLGAALLESAGIIFAIRYENSLILEEKSYSIIREIYDEKELLKIQNISFEIDDAAAEKIYNRIVCLEQGCDKEYHYDSFTNSCLHFAQEMYVLAGLEGDHFNLMHPNIYPISWLGAYKAFVDFAL